MYISSASKTQRKKRVARDLKRHIEKLKGALAIAKAKLNPPVKPAKIKKPAEPAPAESTPAPRQKKS